VKNISKFFGFVVIVCFIIPGINCSLLFDSDEDEIGETIIYTCPSNTGTMTWKSYGQWKLGKEGYDGWSSNGSYHLEKDCNWLIYNGHVGGPGATYQVINPDSSLIFLWAYGNFMAFYINSKWEGQTEEDISIGSFLSDFKNAYPYFTYGYDSASQTASCFWRSDSIVHIICMDTVWECHNGDTTLSYVYPGLSQNKEKTIWFIKYESTIKAFFDTSDQLKEISVTCW